MKAITIPRTQDNALNQQEYVYRSKGHVCFARRVYEGGSIAAPIVKIDDEAVKAGDYEYYVGVDGVTLMRGEIHNDAAAHDSVVVAIGSQYIRALCRRLGCRIPIEALEREMHERGIVFDDDDEQINPAQRSALCGALTKCNTRGRGTTMAKGITSGMGVAKTWAKLLAENEQIAAKREGKPLTDAQLVKAMQEEFPDKKDKTTITRISMVRSIYNAGTSMFANMGKPQTPSIAYDEDGKPAAPKKRGRKKYTDERSEAEPTPKKKKRDKTADEDAKTEPVLKKKRRKVLANT